MNTIILISLCIFAVSWSANADQVQQFKIYDSAKSSDINKYVRDLVTKVSKDLQDKSYLALNQTALNDIRNGMEVETYVAVVINKMNSSSSNYIVKVQDVRAKTTSSSSESSSSEEESYESIF